MTESLPYPLIDVIQRYLEEAGWESPDRPGIRWVDHRHTTSEGEAWIRYLPTIDRLILDVRFSDVGATIAVPFHTQSLAALLEALVQRTPTLTANSWPAFVASLQEDFSPIRAIVEGEAVDLTPESAVLRPRDQEESAARLLGLDDVDDDEDPDE